MYDEAEEQGADIHDSLKQKNGNPLSHDIQMSSTWADFMPATGEQLDKLGELMECSRNADESDEVYRPRILSTFDENRGR